MSSIVVRRYGAEVQLFTHDGLNNWDRQFLADARAIKLFELEEFCASAREVGAEDDTEILVSSHRFWALIPHPEGGVG